MRTHSWSKPGPRFLSVAPLLCLLACSSGGSTGEPVNAGGSGTIGSSGASATHAGAGGSIASSGGGSVPGGGMSFSGGGSDSGAAGSAGAPMSSMAGSMTTDPCASVTCGTGQSCSNGACVCMTGMLCSGACVDTENDQNHCGGCTTQCAADGACVSGACVNPISKPDTEVRQGHVTHYSLATGMDACHYPTSTLPQYYGAMNEYDWNASGV